MPTDLERQIRREAARRAVRARGLEPRQIRAQLRRWARPSPPKSIQGEYWRAIRALLRDHGRAEIEPPTEAQIRAVVRPHGIAVVRANARKYDTELGAALGLAGPSGPLREVTLRADAIDPDLESRALESWTRENVALIKGATTEQIERITATVFRAQRDGTRASDLEAEIARIMRSSESRARLIARDQAHKFGGQLDRLKQTDAGIDGFIWRSSGDERVRPRHRQLNGRRFPWDAPPPDGHPGQPVQCRCQAEPDLSDLLGPELAG